MGLLLATALVSTATSADQGREFDENQKLVKNELQHAETRFQELQIYQHLLDKFATQAATEEALSLDEAVFLALTHDIDLAQSHEGILAADAAASNALHGYLPRVSLYAEVLKIKQKVLETDNQVFQQGKAKFGSTRYQGELLQPLLDLGRYRAIETARTGRAAARAAFDSDVHTAVYQTTTIYLRALEAKAQLDGIESRIQLLQEQQQAEQRVERTGFGTSDAGNLIAMEIGAAYSEQITYLSQYAQALADLSRSIGQPVSGVQPVRFKSAVDTVNDGQSVDAQVQAALSQNPAMVLQRLETLRSQRALSEQWAHDFVPTLEAFYRVEIEDRDGSRFGGGSKTEDSTVGLQLRVPLFNASGKGYRSREERVRLRQSVLRELSLRRELEAEIGTLIPRLAMERAVYEEAQRSIEASEKLVESARRSKGLGMATELMVLRQSLHSVLAKTRAQRSYYAYQATRVRLAFLTGRPIQALF